MEWAHLNTAVLAGTGNTLNITSSVGLNTSTFKGDVFVLLELPQ